MARPTAAAIKSDLTARVAAAEGEGRSRPASARSWSGTTPAARSTSQASTGTARRWASRPSSANCPPPPPRRRSRRVVRELQRGPDLHRLHRPTPAPQGIDENRILELMDPDKDADGLHPMNLGRLVLNEPAPLPAPRTVSSPSCAATAWRSRAPRSWSSGRGSPSAARCRSSSPGAARTRRSTQCHTGTRDLSSHLKRADIIVAAAGSAHLIRPRT